MLMVRVECCWEARVGRGTLPTRCVGYGVCMPLCVSFIESLLDWLWGGEQMVPRGTARPRNCKDGGSSEVFW